METTDKKNMCQTAVIKHAVLAALGAPTTSFWQTGLYEALETVHSRVWQHDR